MSKARLNMQTQRKQIINRFLDTTEFRAKVLHVKKVHFKTLNDSIYNEASPEEN